MPRLKETTMFVSLPSVWFASDCAPVTNALRLRLVAAKLDSETTLWTWMSFSKTIGKPRNKTRKWVAKTTLMNSAKPDAGRLTTKKLANTAACSMPAWKNASIKRRTKMDKSRSKSTVSLNANNWKTKTNKNTTLTETKFCTMLDHTARNKEEPSRLEFSPTTNVPNSLPRAFMMSLECRLISPRNPLSRKAADRARKLKNTTPKLPTITTTTHKTKKKWNHENFAKFYTILLESARPT
mmetsp:Transcript_17921/g.38962  ORF Transcript_17921/g.38962 Transcript_17921/m.38962 type:complete len:239 (+) Transcript_17921:279-995(+)